MFKLLSVVMFPLLKNDKKFAFWGEYDKGYYGKFKLPSSSFINSGRDVRNYESIHKLTTVIVQLLALENLLVYIEAPVSFKMESPISYLLNSFIKSCTLNILPSQSSFQDASFQNSDQYSSHGLLCCRSFLRMAQQKNFTHC